jgi:hypothetical protein
MKAALRQLYNEASSNTLQKRNQMKMARDAELIDLKYALSIIKDRDVRSWHDKILGNLFGYNDTTQRTTKVFDQFIRGITVFVQTHDANAKPQYHRSSSCGPKVMQHGDYKDSRSCKLSHNIDTLKRNKKLIFKCYLERQIYDMLHTHFSWQFRQRGDDQSVQDPGHIAMLKDVAKDFQSCHPNVQLSVRLEYMKDLPIQMEVILSNTRTRTVMSHETFVKSLRHSGGPVEHYDLLYAETVFCKMVESGKAPRYKQQTFHMASAYGQPTPTIIAVFDEAHGATREVQPMTASLHDGFKAYDD